VGRAANWIRDAYARPRGGIAGLSWGEQPIVVRDPSFVAEMPGSRGVVVKIGHFDEVDGVTHVEI
jgi:hypothetical protein